LEEITAGVNQHWTLQMELKTQEAWQW